MTELEKIMQKVENDEELTVEEVTVYEANVKPVKHVYGKYGTLAKQYLEEHAVGKYWGLIAAGALPEYLHGIDRQADELYETMEKKLSLSEQYKRTGNFIEDARRINAMQKVIEEEILAEIVYVA